MVVQEKDYVEKQKKKYFKGLAIWTLAVLGVFFVGIFAFGSRKNYGTVVAGVLVLGMALNLSRYIGFSRFKDGNKEYAEILEGMKGTYNLFHSAIIPDTRGTSFFEHIVVTSRSIYVINYDANQFKKTRLALENKLQNKGIEIKQIHCVTVNSPVEVKNLALKIEKDACFTDPKIEEYTRIINELLM